MENKQTDIDMGDKEGLLYLLPCVQNCLQFTLLLRKETNQNVFMEMKK